MAYPRFKTGEELITAFNDIADKHKALGSTLEDLTDNELYVFIAGKTLDFGRSLAASLENAALHLVTSEKRAWIVKSLSTRYNDLLGFNG